MTIPNDRPVCFDVQKVPAIEFAAAMEWLQQLQCSDETCLSEKRVARVQETVRLGAELTQEEALQLSFPDLIGLLQHMRFGGERDAIPPSNGDASQPGPTA